MRKDFRFKQFSISDLNSAMKVGTDAVLLGAWIDVSQSENILDIGTGSGIIATMLAQRSQANIDAIDIDMSSIKDAQNNFRNCPWADQLNAINISIQEFASKSDKKYDLVVSNPPFFSNSLKAVTSEKTISKHDVKLTHQELITGVKKLLKPSGRFCVIIPVNEFVKFVNFALVESLYLTKELKIFPKPQKNPNRYILEFSNSRPYSIHKEHLCIRNADNKYTQQYLKLTEEFYINLT